MIGRQQRANSCAALGRQLLGEARPHAVYREAFDAAIEIWADALRERRNPSRDRFRIRDNSGNVVLELPLSELGERLPPRR